MADLIQATALKRAIAESCALPEWVRALVNCVIDDQETVDADAAVPYGGLSMDEKDVTDKNVGSKADEMFRELGYSEVLSNTNEKWYKKKNGNLTITLIIDLDMKYIDCRIGRVTYPMQFGEILACAQLIREMEAQEDG